MIDQNLNLNNELEFFSIKLKENLDNKSLEDIIYKLKLLKKKYSNNADIYNFLVLFNNKKKNYSEAITICKEGIKLFPRNANLYYVLGESLSLSNKFEQAINYYKKTILLNNNHYLSYYALGNIMWHKLNIEEAINNYKKALDINKNFAEAQEKLQGAIKEREYLIDYLTIFKVDNYKNANLNSIINTNQKLQKIKFKYQNDKKITDNNIIELYNKIQKVINSTRISKECDSLQIHRKSLIQYNCSRHMKVFDQFNIIPEYCFNCYKVQIEPENVLDLLKLYIVFDNLTLKRNLNRKCMIEIRNEVKGAYKGLIFCNGLKEAQSTLKLLNPILDTTINNNISRFIKRGCSEFGLSYPEYTEINPKKFNFMKYNPKWQVKEKIVDNEINKDKLKTPIIKESLSGITLKDGLIMNNWLIYAKKIGDISLDKIDEEVPNSEFMNKILSDDLINSRKKFFSENLS